MRTLIALVTLLGVTDSSQQRALRQDARDRRLSRVLQAPLGGGDAEPGPLFTTARVSLKWPYPGADRLPNCTDDSSCVYKHGVGVVDGGTAYQWLAHDGTEMTGTDPGTGTVINSFVWGVKALDIRAGGQAPHLVSTLIDPLYGQAASTSLMCGYGRVAGRVDNLNWWFDGYAGGLVGYIQRYLDHTGGESGAGPGFFVSTQSAPGADPSLVDGWGVMLARYDGVNGCGDNTHATLLLNEVNTEGCNTSRRDMAAGTVYYFGGNSTHTGAQPAGTEFLNGPLLGGADFNADKSLRARYDMLDKVWGSYNAAQRLVIATSASVQGESIDNTAITGNVDVLWTKAPLVTSTGLRTVKHHQNLWADDALDLGSAVDVGTPVVTANVAVGPSGAMLAGAAKADRLADDSAVAMEGKQSLELFDGGRESKYRMQDFAAIEGTLSTATVTWVTDGVATPSSCAFTLTSSWQRLQCVSKITDPTDGGTLTTVKARIFPGTTAAETGSIIVDEPQNTEGPYSEPPWATSRAQPTTFYELDPAALSDGGAWPSQLDGGAIEIVHVPLFDPDALTVQPAIDGDPEYFFDAYQTVSQDHTMVMVGGYTGHCRLLSGFRTGDGTNTDLLTENICYTPGHAYAERMEWTSLGAGACELYVWHTDCGAPPQPADNTPAVIAAWRDALSAFTDGCKARTMINSLVDGTGTCPGAPDLVKLGNRLTNNVPTSARFLAVRVFN